MLLDGLAHRSDTKIPVHILTSNGKEYLSDLSEVKITPPIDSVTGRAGPDMVTIYVSTHDDQKKSIYYQWTFRGNLASTVHPIFPIIFMLPKILPLTHPF